ncbi:hypothetical protein EYR40_001128 [Pleurotus pulmonarius]|nr:hypothetical protein EYR36_004859 [Pleurotus pulmonarius]KAF4578715.1 hypothetical protein EYR36_000522 [Pleurotus pulmonarius]KAF4603953.1 hypothetical protein EYR38_004369 [Pleurotus pulmonarius]KAF4608781.1 hypothetical protein EYR40_001128 [Pleurotus pulmonarius]
MSEQPLWQETPLILSSGISKRLGCNAYLKLENLHPSHSFKYRGISHFIQQAKSTHGASVHLVVASGGNAGLAAACAANALNAKCTVFIPDGATKSTIALLERQNADVVVGGASYLYALEAARNMVRAEAKAVLVPAYENKIVWEGHASMIKEIYVQLVDKPDAIFCSVGGGGLLGGLILGCKAVDWDDVPIVTLETIGTDCFYHTMRLNRDPSHDLPADARAVKDDEYGLALAFFHRLSSRASGSLGASSPAPGVVKMALERKGGVRCVTIPDELAMQAAMDFADDHKMLVELACSTTLVPAYKPSLFARLVPSSAKSVVFIVCGGFKVSLSDMTEYRDIVDEDLKAEAGSWDVFCDGDVIKVDK